MDTSTRRAAGGALAGAGAATLWAAPAAARQAIVPGAYDDIELLGKLATRGPAWPAAGLLMHAGNGAFGTVYALVRPHLPGLLVQAVAAAMAENFGFWPWGA